MFKLTWEFHDKLSSVLFFRDFTVALSYALGKEYVKGWVIYYLDSAFPPDGEVYITSEEGLNACWGIIEGLGDDYLIYTEPK